MRRRVMLAVAGFLAVRHPAPPASALVLWTGAGGRSVCGDAVRSQCGTVTDGLCVRVEQAGTDAFGAFSPAAPATMISRTWYYPCMRSTRPFCAPLCWQSRKALPGWV